MRRLLVGTIAMGLAGCGGGGGGSGDSFVPAGVTPVAFESFSSLEPDSVVDIPAGDALQGTVQLDADADVTGFGPFGPVSANLRSRLDEAAEAEALQLTVDGRRVTFEFDDPDLEVFGEPDAGVVAIGLTTDSGIETLVLADPEALAFEYQTFGLWLGGDTGSGEARLGAGAFGAPTAVAEVPVDGTASYSGLLVGIAVFDDQIVDGVAAIVGLDADFAAQSIAFGSTETVVDDVPDVSLDMSGTLDIADGRFVGPVTTAGGLSGAVNGRFYGPDAVEAAGVFDLVGDGVERFTGSFGATQ